MKMTVKPYSGWRLGGGSRPPLYFLIVIQIIIIWYTFKKPLDSTLIICKTITILFKGISAQIYAKFLTLIVQSAFFVQGFPKSYKKFKSNDRK